MSRTVFSALLVMLAASTSAHAGCSSCNTPLVSPCGGRAAPVYNPCTPCYRPAVVPPQYRTVYDTVVVAPARVVERRVPARYGVVNETVMVSPPSQTWQSSCACGRETLPPHVVREVIPAQYGTVARTEMVSGPREVWVPADQY